MDATKRRQAIAHMSEVMQWYVSEVMQWYVSEVMQWYVSEVMQWYVFLSHSEYE